MKSEFIYKTLFYALAALFLPLAAQAQNSISGRVTETLSEGKQEGLPSATVYWAGTAIVTSTDMSGRFTIAPPDSGQRQLVASFVGYKADTITWKGQKSINFNLKSVAVLQEVEVRGKIETYKSLTPVQTEVITARELTKAACCNLSESFETNATVEVHMSDAVTGAKQIQMLGLDGVYTQMTIENYPSLRGVAMPYRLMLISGTWIDGIDIIKGMGSVINGYESITGQINVRLKNPENTDRLFVNQYVNSLGKFDTNLNYNHKINKTWNSTLMLHAEHLGNKVDRNNDNFMDQPLNTQLSAFSKTKYHTEKGFEGEFGIGVMKDERTGGQVNNTENNSGNGIYRTESDIERVEVYAKNGYVFQRKPSQSIGLILSGVHHNMDAKYGLRNYDARQQTFYSNLIFQSILGNTAHSYKAGIGYTIDKYDENFQDFTAADSSFSRTEHVPGVFAEYVYKVPEKLTMVLGARADHHNLYGPFFTPRANIKYDVNASTIWRLSAGRGFRVPNPIAENTGSLVSSRRFVVTENLLPEIAWNYGTSVTKKFLFGERTTTFILDYYYTDFENQVVVDMYSRPDALLFYNLQGKSFSHSAQAEVHTEITERLEAKLAYKFYDVKSTYNNQLLDRQFNSRHRWFFNIGYATNFEKWKFDFTTQWFGRKPIPMSGLDHNHGSEISFDRSPSFTMFNAQITRSFLKWDIYLGGENLGNYRQPNPIVDAANPYGPNFDAGMTWGPVVGRVIYAGVRYKIER